MKVWVVITNYGAYEGRTEPHGVYSSEEKAKAAAFEEQTRSGWSGVEVLEYELDAAS